MTEEKSPIDEIRDFARSTNRSVEIKEIPYPVTGIRTIQKFKRMIYLPNNENESSFFIWYSDPYLRIGQSSVFSGAFISLPEKLGARMNMRRRNVLDKISLFSSNKQNRIGKPYFDSKVFMTGELDTGVKRFLSSARIQEQIIKALQIEKYMNVWMNEYPIAFVPGLKEKPYLSIVNPLSWETNRDNIEAMLRAVEKIQNSIQLNS